MPGSRIPDLGHARRQPAYCMLVSVENKRLVNYRLVVLKCYPNAFRLGEKRDK